MLSTRERAATAAPPMRNQSDCSTGGNAGANRAALYGGGGIVGGVKGGVVGGIVGGGGVAGGGRVGGATGGAGGDTGRCRIVFAGSAAIARATINAAHMLIAGASRHHHAIRRSTAKPKAGKPGRVSIGFT